MRFLADENFPGPAVRTLASRGHDVVWVRLTSPGASDQEILAQALSEERVLLTFDKDFGDLARRSPLRGSSGVVPFRMPMPGRDRVGLVIADAITARDDWVGHFSVVEPGRVRMRPIK
jgi:hypothetical protein